MRQHNTVGHLEEMEPDSRYEWVTPDEGDRRPFSRDQVLESPFWSLLFFFQVDYAKSTSH